MAKLLTVPIFWFVDFSCSVLFSLHAVLLWCFVLWFLLIRKMHFSFETSVGDINPCMRIMTSRKTANCRAWRQRKASAQLSITTVAIWFLLLWTCWLLVSSVAFVHVHMPDYILNCMLGGWAVVMVVAGYPTHNGYESVGQQASVVQQCESTAQKIKKRLTSSTALCHG